MPAGVIRKLEQKDQGFYTAKDVMDVMDVSRDKAYRMIRDVVREMEKRGKMGRGFPPGKVPKWLFRKYYMLDETDL